ncbi:adenine deaminase C-terminal domain-containing protein [Alkalihalobacillus sp. LMS39]|uniref:adenine deaminase C-terminal domain-containing protein n=1 Tax=Alkalihalobacillus sp. LMS39 TaxID=2924032 RepID=UPI001FB48491|nr:adenine deaminase C-terminal domain-containing protein [Alkalihalobacillus sp. LMS39]UOE94487.1 amidohydrolase family protein [Alkalihalobacillus sp. LMS39]
MADRIHRWTKKLLRQQLAVIRGEMAPTILLTNATYLNSARRKWLSANIWIYEDRIVYVGELMPTNLVGTEIVDCHNDVVVPGYIEHHAHPFQLYNPHSFAKYASQKGTTTLINDNMMFFLSLEKKKALTLIETLDQTLPTSMYWWCRYDAQTELEEEEEVFSYSKMKAWLEHHLVVQGGELTSWPKVLGGDDSILHWMQETKRLGKPIEGHLPGASERTLAQMAILGVNCDHEAMTGKEAVMRLDMGYTTSLRYSSIRPDLPKIIEEMLELGIDDFSRCLFTTDGSTPAFYEQGIIDKMIAIAIEKGVPTVEAYHMATYNVAKHYNIDSKLGMIAPGRMAHLNILSDKENPVPHSVLGKGKWVRKNHVVIDEEEKFPWHEYGIKPLQLDFDVTMDDFHFSMPLGIEMANAVILKPYQIGLEDTMDALETSHDECYFVMLDKQGKWRINTIIKGFADSLGGFASSYSNTGDVILIGKKKQDMITAFQQLKQQGGGIVIVEDGQVLSNLSLPLLGCMSNESMDVVIQKQKEIVSILKEKGYKHEDPIYSILFFSSTHLPYIRITQKGIYDVFNKNVLFPSIMR